jgi:hypothetical protein
MELLPGGRDGQPFEMRPVEITGLPEGVNPAEFILARLTPANGWVLEGHIPPEA